MRAVLSFIRPFHSNLSIRVEGLLFPAVLLLVSSHFGKDYQNWQWSMGLAAAFLVPEWRLYPKRFGILTVALFYFIFQALFTSFQVLTQDKNILLLVMAWIVVLSFLAAGQLGRWFAQRGNPSFIGYFGLLDSFYVICRSVGGIHQFDGRQNGFLDYVGLNGALIAVTWPFLIENAQNKTEKFFFTSVVLVALWLGKATIPYGVLAVVMASYLYLKESKLQAFLVGIFTSLLAFIQGFRYPSGVDRFTAYKTFLGFWAHHFSWSFGSGAGSFRMLSGYIQTETGYGYRVINETTSRMAWWPWMHSDWLQCLFEYGWIGLVLSIAIFLTSLRKLYIQKDIAYFSMLLGIGFTALCDYPLKYFVFELLVAISVIRAHEPFEGQLCQP